MYTNSILAATGALLSVVAAIPMADQHHHHHPQKREYVWVTHTEAVIKTIPVTKTVWVEPGEAPEKTPAVYPAAYSKEHSSAPSPSAYTRPAAPSSASSNSETYAAPSTSSSTSVYVAPAPTTPSSTYVAPAPTTYAAPTTKSAAAATYNSDSGSSGSGLSSGMGKSGTSYTGDLTWYDVGTGACGWTNVASQRIVAISHAIFDSYSTGNPNTNPLCGQHVTITGKDGNPYNAKIVDRCPGCDTGSLDLSLDLFNNATNHGDGRVSGMKWSFD